MRLLRVTFCEFYSLKQIGMPVFMSSSLSEIHIPEVVEELCDECFWYCESLSSRLESVCLVGLI